MDFHVVKRVQRHRFIRTVPLLSHLNTAKTNDINNIAADFQVVTGEVIYDIGVDASVVYILREGTVLMETTIEIDNFNKYPVGGHEWEVRKETKTIQYKL
jgi:hypothetical protein